MYVYMSVCVFIGTGGYREGAIGLLQVNGECVCVYILDER